MRAESKARSLLPNNTKMKKIKDPNSVFVSVAVALHQCSRVHRYGSNLEHHVHGEVQSTKYEHFEAATVGRVA